MRPSRFDGSWTSAGPARRRDVATADALAAFEAFLGFAGDRPFFLAGHSQGGLHALRILTRRVAGDEGLRRPVWKSPRRRGYDVDCPSAALAVAS